MGDALEHSADERPAIMAQPQPDERAPHGGIGVRRSLARQVRRERQPLGAGLPGHGLAQQRLDRDVAAAAPSAAS